MAHHSGKAESSLSKTRTFFHEDQDSACRHMPIYKTTHIQRLKSENHADFEAFLLMKSQRPTFREGRLLGGGLMLGQRRSSSATPIENNPRSVLACRRAWESRTWTVKAGACTSAHTSSAGSAARKTMGARQCASRAPRACPSHATPRRTLPGVQQRRG